VRLLDMTAAYGVFATGGIYHPPSVILEITSEDDGIIHDPLLADMPLANSFVISPQAAYLTTHILSDNDARAPTFGLESPLRLSRPAAAKTGTTTNWRDNWTVGYTPDLVVGVWVGNASGAPMSHVSGVNGAGPIWHDFMEAAHHGLPIHDFSVPDRLVWRDICPISGHLAGPDCSHSRREVFITGTEPQVTCDQHVRVPVDRRTGRPTTAETPSSAVVEKAFWVPPPELREWARSRGIPQLELGDSRSGPASTDLQTRQLVLTSLDFGATFELAPGIPRDQQRIAVEAEAYTQDWPLRVILTVDGEILAELTEPPYRAVWTLEVGEHVFQAVAKTRDGSLVHSEPVRVFVIE
jgi:membrane peptidoglycan carboxypeptidase